MLVKPPSGEITFLYDYESHTLLNFGSLFFAVLLQFVEVCRLVYACSSLKVPRQLFFQVEA